MARSIFERWGIEQPDEAEWDVFINRLKMLYGDGSDKLEALRDNLKLVAFRLGVGYEAVAYTNRYGGESYLKVDELINSSKSTFELARVVEATISLLSSSRQETVKTLVNKSSCGFNLHKENEDWITLPEGEELLDEKLVREPLSFLVGKPSEQFKKALGDYTSGKSVESAEKVRRTLEEYFRQLYKSSNLGLDAGIKKYLKDLKDRGVHDHIRLLVTKDLNRLDAHFNDSSKHQSATVSIEAEYLIYITGAVLRFIDQVNRLYPPQSLVK
jgi:hypothetical protein